MLTSPMPSGSKGGTEVLHCNPSGQVLLLQQDRSRFEGSTMTFPTIIAIAARWVASADHDMQLQVCVDDPIALLQGSESVQKRMACLVIVVWSLMGFPIATHRAVLSSSLVWIGVQLRIEDGQVQAEVPAARVELNDLLAERQSRAIWSA